MRINNNISALNAYRNLVSTDNRLNKSLERLSSGLRINRAADDAAGLAISEKMRGQIRGLNQAMRNAQDAISLIQTAEGALNETHSILQRMRELSVQAASDTLTSSDRMEIQKEIDQLTAEIDRIANTTEFNTKKLLDGTTSALTSTDNLKTKVFMRDGLRTIDQFGQKAVGGGNYKLSITADPGLGQVQKTDIMKVKHAGKTINWTNVAETEEALQAALLDFDGVEGVEIDLVDPNGNNQALKVETEFNESTGVLTVKANLATDGAGSVTSTVADVNAALMAAMVQEEGLGAVNEVQVLNLGEATTGSFTLSFGGEITSNLSHDVTATALQTALEGLDSIGAGNVTVASDNDVFNITFQGELAGTDVSELVFAEVAGFDGTSAGVSTATEGQSGPALSSIIALNVINGEQVVAAGETKLDEVGEVAVNIGDIANKDTAIFDIDRFWDASGNFLVSSPQTITLVQGDGKTTSLTIFGTDTIGEIEDKLNNAIHNGLEQKDVQGTDGSGYVKYVDDPADEGFFSVKGTYIIQSAVTGKDGQITFVGDDNVINALSLTTIRQASETQYTVTVNDAHDGRVVAEDVKISGNMLVGVVHNAVDVKFDAMAGLEFEANEDGVFEWIKAEGEYETFVHLADNTQVFHIGANPLQDIAAAIGDLRAESLGVNNLLVTNRPAANDSIAAIDRAIGAVSSERSKLGAVQNRLEHTINNLGVAAENLTAAESRIRDLDFAMEMIEFTRNQIMLQAGTAMLAQANMKPQTVLMLLG